MLLPTYDVFDEMRNFAPAKSQQLFQFCGKQMALTICEDAWNDKRFWNQASLRQSIRSKNWFAPAAISCSIFPRRPSGWASANCAATCWPPSPGNQKVPVAMVNQVGGNDSLVFDGSSLVIDARRRGDCARASRLRKT